MKILGQTCLNVGRYCGDMAGAPNYVSRYRRFRIPRLLYHSGLDELIQYPCTPDKTINFSLDLLAKVDFAEQKTLTSNITQQWDAVANDAIIEERFEGDLSQEQSFFHSMYYFWRTLLDTQEYLIWRPLDLTDKLYRVQILKLELGGKDFDPTFVGNSQPDKWMTTTFGIFLKLIPTFPPSAAVFANGPLLQ